MAALIVLLVLLAIGFDVASWVRFGLANPSLSSGKELATLGGLLANLVALFLPIAYGLSLSLQRSMNSDSVLYAVLGLCGLSSIVSFLSMKPVRSTLLLASIATALFWTLVPKATQWP